MSSAGSRNGQPQAPAPMVRRSLGARVEAMLDRRSEQFARATSGKGQPTTWGVGKDVRPGFEPKPRRQKGRR